MKRKFETDKIRTILLNFSPWILAIACTLLLLLLSLFALSNYQREKALIVEALGQKGLTLMRFINSSVRESMREYMRSSKTVIRWEEHMQGAMEQAVEQPGVEFVLIAESSGKILTGVGNDLPVQSLDSETLHFALGVHRNKEKQFISRMVTAENGGKKIIQIASQFHSPVMRGGPPEFFRRGRMMRQSGHHPQFQMMQEQMGRLLESKPIYIVQLDFGQFNSPLQNQLLQIIILLVVTILVGVGGTLSYLTLKGLKGSQVSLGKITAFADILVSSLPVGLIATDSSGVIQVYNASARDILEIDHDKILGQIPGLCLPDVLSKMFSGTGGSEYERRQSEYLLELAPEKHKSLQLSSIVVLDDVGEFGGEVLLIRDLTEVKLLERELERSERLAALGKMAAGVAHELRNPLSSIKGLAVLLKTNFSEQSKEAETADILVKEVERLNRSIGELLDYAKPGTLNKELVDISEIIQKTISLVQIDAESFNIDVELLLAEDIPQIQLDGDKIKQVFLNLLLNSVQAMQDGGSLSVRATREGGWVVVTVGDNGTGIKQENIRRVFDPYYTTKSYGTGLGLSLSVKIIEEHGGQIKITSSPGEFTEVSVLLPV